MAQLRASGCHRVSKDWNRRSIDYEKVLILFSSISHAGCVELQQADRILEDEQARLNRFLVLLRLSPPGSKPIHRSNQALQVEKKKER